MRKHPEAINKQACTIERYCSRDKRSWCAFDWKETIIKLEHEQFYVLARINLLEMRLLWSSLTMGHSFMSAFEGRKGNVGMFATLEVSFTQPSWFEGLLIPISLRIWILEEAEGAGHCWEIHVEFLFSIKIYPVFVWGLAVNYRRLCRSSHQFPMAGLYGLNSKLDLSPEVL